VVRGEALAQAKACTGLRGMLVERNSLYFVILCAALSNYNDCRLLLPHTWKNENFFLLL
jgi:hypothetical protein